MKRFSSVVLVVVSVSFAALKFAHAQAPASTPRSQCLSKCAETMQTCMKSATTPPQKEACRKTLKSCALGCPK